MDPVVSHPNPLPNILAIWDGRGTHAALEMGYGLLQSRSPSEKDERERSTRPAKLSSEHVEGQKVILLKLNYSHPYIITDPYMFFCCRSIHYIEIKKLPYGTTTWRIKQHPPRCEERGRRVRRRGHRPGERLRGALGRGSAGLGHLRLEGRVERGTTSPFGVKETSPLYSK